MGGRRFCIFQFCTRLDEGYDNNEGHDWRHLQMTLEEAGEDILESYYEQYEKDMYIYVFHVFVINFPTQVRILSAFQY